MFLWCVQELAEIEEKNIICHTATATQLPTATATQLSTATDTQLPTATDTQLPTATDTLLPTATDTQLPTAADTQLPTATDTQLSTATVRQLPTAAAGVSGDVSRTLGEYNRKSCSVLNVHFLFTAENDLCDVLAVIHDLNDWIDLGLRLGLLYSTLKRIDLEQRGRISSCKIEMLSAWLQQQDNVSQKGVPKWSVLRAALKQMGEHKTADRIPSN